MPHPERRTVRDHRGHHPWRFLGEHLRDWKVVWTDDLRPGDFGETVHSERRIYLAHGMNEAERRSTLAHETGHVLRGPQPADRELYEEALADRQAARLLLPSVRRIGQSLAWHHADHDAVAKDLWVDPEILDVRLSTLAPRERAWLDEQLQLIQVSVTHQGPAGRRAAALR